MTPEAVLALMLEQAPHHTDVETESERRARLLPAAAAIVRTAKRYRHPRMIAAALLTLGRNESRWAAYVGEGRCTEGPAGARCDPDKDGNPRARTYWQLWRVSCTPAWLLPAGSDLELDADTRCAARLWVSAYNRCKGTPDGPVAGAFGGYRSACRWVGGKPRAVEFERVLARL